MFTQHLSYSLTFEKDNYFELLRVDIGFFDVPEGTGTCDPVGEQDRPHHAHVTFHAVDCKGDFVLVEGVDNTFLRDHLFHKDTICGGRLQWFLSQIAHSYLWIERRQTRVERSMNKELEKRTRQSLTFNDEKKNSFLFKLFPLDFYKLRYVFYCNSVRLF